MSIRTLLAEQSALEAGWKALVHEAHATIAAADSDANDDDRDACKAVEQATEARGRPREALLGSSTLLHFATEVENEVDAIRELLETLEASVRGSRWRAVRGGMAGGRRQRSHRSTA